MSEDQKKPHKKYAVECFNRTWDLIDNSDRTNEETQSMITMAHASRFHWGEIGSPLEFARGDWQISRVYAICGEGELAYMYANSSLNHCLENAIGDFDLAFAYEALARSAAILGHQKQQQKYYQLAMEAARSISDKDNRDYFLAELSSIE
jgi:hypothetical protein